MPHQDAHEFLNYLLNECSELLEKEAKAKLGPMPNEPVNGALQNHHAQQQQQQQQRAQSGQHASTSAPDGASPAAPQLPPTFIQEIFQVSVRC